MLLWFVASSTESEPFSLAVKGQTWEPISSQQGALATNQAPKRVHYLPLLIKGPFWSRLITSGLPYSISLSSFPIELSFDFLFSTLLRVCFNMIYPLFKIESGTYCKKTISHMKVKLTVVLYSGYEINDLKTRLRTLEELLSFNVFASITCSHFSLSLRCCAKAFILITASYNPCFKKILSL